MSTNPVTSDRGALRKKRILKLKRQQRSGTASKEASEPQCSTEKTNGDADLDAIATDDEGMASDPNDQEDTTIEEAATGMSNQEIPSMDEIKASRADDSEAPPSSARTLASSVWAAPRKGEMSAFLDDLYDQQEKERASTRKLLASFVGDLDAICEKTCSEASTLKNQTVEQVAADLRAFVKGTIVTSIAGSSPVTAIKSGPPKPNANGVAISEKARETKAKTTKSKTLTKEQTTTSPSYAAMASAPAVQPMVKPLKQNNKAKGPKSSSPAQPSVNSRRVYIQLDQESPRREEHPLLVVKAVNMHFPPNKGISTASVVRSGLALTLQEGTLLPEVQARQSAIEGTLGGRLVLDEKWTIVKIHGLPRRVTYLDDGLKLCQRDPDLESEVVPDVISAFGVAPRSVLVRDALEKPDYLTLRLAFQEDKMEARPAHMVIMGVRASVSYPTRRPTRAPLCKRCWEGHLTKDCKSEHAKCRICRSAEHDAKAHIDQIPARPPTLSQSSQQSDVAWSSAPEAQDGERKAASW